MPFCLRVRVEEDERVQLLRASRRAQRHCHHHWLIEAADGPTSPAQCKLYGAVRMFRNAFEGTPWEERTNLHWPSPQLSTHPLVLRAPRRAKYSAQSEGNRASGNYGRHL